MRLTFTRGENARRPSCTCLLLDPGISVAAWRLFPRHGKQGSTRTSGHSEAGRLRPELSPFESWLTRQGCRLGRNRNEAVNSTIAFAGGEHECKVCRVIDCTSAYCESALLFYPYSFRREACPLWHFNTRLSLEVD
jgi:hypothetical protein